MRFALPEERFTLELPQPPEQVIARLRTEVEPRQLLRVGRPRTFFEGTVHDGGFQVRRVVRHRELGTQIYGRLWPSGTGTRLEVTVSAHPFVLAILIVWFGMAGMFGLVALFALAVEGNPLMLVVVGVMAAFGYLLSRVNLHGEADKVKRHFVEVFGLPTTGSKL